MFESFLSTLPGFHQYVARLGLALYDALLIASLKRSTPLSPPVPCPIPQSASREGEDTNPLAHPLRVSCPSLLRPLGVSGDCHHIVRGVQWLSQSVSETAAR